MVLYFSMVCDFSARRAEKSHTSIGLSLTTLSPATAWYFVFMLCRFLPPSGAKNDTQVVQSDRRAKVLKKIGTHHAAVRPERSRRAGKSPMQSRIAVL